MSVRVRFPSGAQEEGDQNISRPLFLYSFQIFNFQGNVLACYNSSQFYKRDRFKSQIDIENYSEAAVTDNFSHAQAHAARKLAMHNSL